METQAVLQLIESVAAELITPRFRSLADGEVSEKAPGDYVTVADAEAEVALTEALLAAHPGSVVVGEEAVAADGTVLDGLAEAEHAWVVDPVDGTGNFVRGSADHAVMVAELRRGETVRAWIHQPQHRSSWVAERGAGVWQDGHRLSAPVVPGDPADWRGAASRKHWREAVHPPLGPIGQGWWCCGVDYPNLLAGTVDFLVHAPPKPWDHLPGTLMVRELGGEALLLSGERYGAASDGQPLVVGLTPELTATVVSALAG